MKVIHGDLIKLAQQGYFEVIVHGCNCFHIMGAGIAAQIAERFPEAYMVDLATSRGNVEKLGEISFVVCERRSPVIVVNAYTQFQTGKDFRLEALISCMQRVRNLFGNKKIGYPRIGSGIGGGDWDRTSSSLMTILDGVDHTLVEYKK